MDEIQIMVEMRSLQNGTKDIGLLSNGQNPLTTDIQELTQYIRDSGVADIDKILYAMGLEKTQKSLATLAYAVSTLQPSQEQGAVGTTTMSGGSQAVSDETIVEKHKDMPGPSQTGAINDAIIQTITEKVKASVLKELNFGQKQVEMPGPTGEAKEDDTQEEPDDMTEAGKSDSIAIVYKGSDIPVGVTVEKNIVEKIFSGVKQEVHHAIYRSDINGHEDISTSAGGEIKHTLSSLVVEEFHLPQGPLKIHANGMYNSYSITIPRISFLVKGEFIYSFTVSNSVLETLCSSLNVHKEGSGTFKVVGKKWAININFRFEGESDGELRLTGLNCGCIEDIVKVTEVNCSVSWLMKMFQSAPRNYVAKQMHLKMVAAFESTILKSAKAVLEGLTWEGSHSDLQMDSFYVNMDEECILRVCRETFQDLRCFLVEKLDPSVANCFPPDMLTKYQNQKISKLNDMTLT